MKGATTNSRVIQVGIVSAAVVVVVLFYGKLIESNTKAPSGSEKNQAPEGYVEKENAETSGSSDKTRKLSTKKKFIQVPHRVNSNADLQRNHQFNSHINRLKKELRDAILSSDFSKRTLALIELARKLVKQSPDEALDFLNQVDNFKDQSLLLDTMVIALHEESPTKAENWIRKIDDIYLQKRGITTLAEKWAMTNLDQAIKWSSNLDDQSLIQAANKGIINEWASRDIKAVTEWAHGIENELIRGDALKDIGTSIAQRSPRAAVDWALAEVSEPSIRGQILEKAIYTLTRQRSAEETAELIEQLGAEIPKDRLVLNHARDWADADPVAAAQWIENSGQLDTQIGDRALFAIAKRFTDNNPENAAEWALEISQDNIRDVILHQVLNIWSQKDRTAVQSWVDTLNDGDVSSLTLSPAIRASSGQD